MTLSIVALQRQSSKRRGKIFGFVWDFYSLIVVQMKLTNIALGI